MQNNSYTSIFGVSLLDDLHNYFPDVLYRSQRFTSIQELLQYIQEETRSRFNLLEVGRRQYNSTHPPATISSPVTSNLSFVTRNLSAQDTSGNLAAYTTPVRSIPVNPISTPPLRPRRSHTLFYDEYHQAETTGMNIFTNLINLMQNPANNFTDVIVYPTNEQIDAATTVQTLTAALEDPCAICQEEMEQGAQTRRIIRCQHSFHHHCIGSWFEQSCICPICRTDIRGT